MKRAALIAVLALSALPARAAGPPYTSHVYERVRAPMRDGVSLSVDIWRPVTGGERVPVILTMTPYHALYYAQDRREDDIPGEYYAKTYVPLGYAYARADVRGTYNSGGCWDYGGLKERQDGYDLVEWLAAQSWSTGRVGMIGISYDGTTANAAAVEAPPHLATIVPISAISRWWGYAYQQGARATLSGENLDIDPPSDTPADFMTAYGFLPTHDMPPDRATEIAMRWRPCDRAQQTLHGYSPRPDQDDFWQERDYLALADRVKVPVLVAHGLADFNVKTWEGTAWFQALATEKVAVLGHWGHIMPDAYPGWRTLLRRWWERWLYEIPNGVENEPAVRVAGNQGGWRTQETWGAGAVSSFPLAGGTRTILDDGLLTESEMIRGLSSSRWVRVPVAGTTGIRFEGRPVLRLRASSDMPGTHFVAILCAVGPSGACEVVSRAFMDARYRDGRAIGEDLVPGATETFALEFIDKDWVLSPDQHLELIVASSSTTWVAPDLLRATNTIDLDASSLELRLR